MSPPRKIVLASRNPDKLRELREVCAAAGIGAEGDYDSPFEIVPSTDYPGLPEVIEDGTTVLGNAARKAIVTAAYTGEIAIGDDTSFQIVALNNLPDIFASRFAGPEATYADNAELVLELMRGVPDNLRQARFVTSAVWVDPTPQASGLAGRPELPPAIRSRWLHNPFARAIHVKDTEREDAFWNGFADRRQVWQEYRARWGAMFVTLGADRDRLLKAFDRLVAPMLGGGRPLDAPPGAIRLPDTRIWTSQGPRGEDATGAVGAAGAVGATSAVGATGAAGATSATGGADAARAAATDQPPTLVTPSGLPSDAPGLAVNQPLWLELSAEGRLLGEIGREPIGFGGFGYDPIFRPEELDRVLAELEPDDKHAISHRGRALRRLLDAARAAYGLDG